MLIHCCGISNLIHCWVISKFIALTSYTESWDTLEVYLVLLHCQAAPSFITLLRYILTQYIAELLPILKLCCCIPCPIFFAELFPILKHWWSTICLITKLRCAQFWNMVLDFGKNAVSQFRKWVIAYLYTLRRTRAYAFKLLNTIVYLNTCITYLNTLTPYPNTSVAYLNTLSRLSAPCRNTCITYLNIHIDSAFGSRLHILTHWTDTTRLGFQSESSTRETSAIGCSILTGSRIGNGYIRKWSQCNKIVNACIKIDDSIQ